MDIGTHPARLALHDLLDLNAVRHAVCGEDETLGCWDTGSRVSEIEARFNESRNDAARHGLERSGGKS